jgi:hypothetical protein
MTINSSLVNNYNNSLSIIIIMIKDENEIMEEGRGSIFCASGKRGRVKTKKMRGGVFPSKIIN